MPEGPAPLEISLRVVETRSTSHDDFKGINDRLDKLFVEKSGWRSVVKVKKGRSHKIVFTHRTINVPSDSETAATCSKAAHDLAKSLCDDKGSLSLKAVSKKVESIRYMPCFSKESDLQRHFNRHFILFTLRSTVRNVFFEDMDEDSHRFLRIKVQKWFLGALQVGVFLSDFLILFDKLASLFPLETIVSQDQSSAPINWDILLQVLKYGAKEAPAFRAAVSYIRHIGETFGYRSPMYVAKKKKHDHQCTAGLGDPDKDKIKRGLVKVDTAVKTAMDEACKELQSLSATPTEDLDDARFDNSVKKIKTDLAQSVEASRKARGIATKESERNLGNIGGCIGKGAVIAVAGLCLAAFGPAAGGALAIDIWGCLVAEGVGYGATGAGACIALIGSLFNGIEMYKADNYIQRLGDLCWRSTEVYSFLALVTLLRTGELDDDEKFIEFASQYAGLFEDAVAPGEWGQPEYTQSSVKLMADHLRKSFEKFKASSATLLPDEAPTEKHVSS
ncbi:hypothetical protein TWF730_003058 [Orbilia blumenaviensis]|uniref:Uncharacterized protein n=1 Tax=Orbilia blumenaviensis TaxID=1796055 RepID=A0AAV9U8K6_9PEZI